MEEFLIEWEGKEGRLNSDCQSVFSHEAMNGAFSTKYYNSNSRENQSENGYASIVDLLQNINLFTR